MIAQADLNLHWAHMPEGKFSDAAAQITRNRPIGLGFSKVTLGICGQQRLRSSCASVQTEQGLCYPL